MYDISRSRAPPCLRGLLIGISRQSQSIQPSYLSTVSEPTPASPNRRVALTRKTDFCLSYSCFDRQFAELYIQLAAKLPVVSHTSDNCTQRLALFSGIEVKPENGGPKKAELQISIWMAASLPQSLFASLYPSMHVHIFTDLWTMRATLH